MKNIKSLFIFLLFIGGFSACSPMISSKVVPTVKVCLNKNPLNGNQLADEIIKLNIKNPNILVWFSGEQGLTKRSYDFYQQELFTGCAQQLKNNYQPYLYTLGGWSRLKDAKTVIDDSHINAIAAKNLCTSYISSNVFFESLSKTTAQDRTSSS
jgi:hypothetical protein